MDFEKMTSLTEQEKAMIEQWVQERVAPENGESFTGYTIAFDFSVLGVGVTIGRKSYEDDTTTTIRDVL